MALQSLIPTLQTQDISQQIPLQNLVPMYAENLPSPPQAALPGLKPLVQPSPNASQLQHDQSIIDAYNNPTKPQGFWHKLGHIAATIGNIGGDVLAPNAMSLIPGTQLNRQVQYGNALREKAGLLQQDQQAQTAQTENALRGAQTEEAKARTQSLENPEDKYTYQQTDHGLMRIDTQTGEASPVTYNGQPLSPYEKPAAVPEVEKPLGPNVENLNKALEDRYQVLNPGRPLPPEFRLPPDAKQGDYQRVDKALAGVESAMGTQQQRAQANAMRQQAMAMAQSNRGDKQDVATKQAVLKLYEPVSDSAERFNVMAKNYEDAVSKHDQQAMLSILANHLGMTMGLQKGARLTKDIIHEAIESRPWLQGIESKATFKNGVLSGVTLTQPQMQQMMDLARNRYAQDVSKVRGEAKYIGAQDDGPERIPSDSVLNLYMHEAGGDAKKAKALAAKDGWSVQ